MALQTGRPAPPAERSAQLSHQVRQLLEQSAEIVPFHGWKHTEFVRDKAVEFANDRDADVDLVEAAALVHDLNYLVAPNSAPSAGRVARCDLLSGCGFGADDVGRIEQIINDAHTAHRQRDVDLETACLSDADTLYKALPITPVLFSHRYLSENGMQLGALAEKIIREQLSKLQEGYYFYDQRLTQRYRPWVEANLRLWETVLEALDDPAIASLID